MGRTSAEVKYCVGPSRKYLHVWIFASRDWKELIIIVTMCNSVSSNCFFLLEQICFHMAKEKKRVEFILYLRHGTRLFIVGELS